jgi:hypothetical protein
MVTRKIIRTDGSETILDGICSITEIADMLGADSVNIIDLDDGNVMLFDDAAYFTNLPVNVKATDIHKLVNPHKKMTIKGDVVIIPSRDLERKSLWTP